MPGSHAVNDPLLRIYFIQPTPGGKVAVQVDLVPAAEGATESSAPRAAVAAWLAEVLMTAVEEAKDSWHGRGEGFADRLVQVADYLDSTNQELHGVLVNKSVGFMALGVPGTPSWFVGLLEGVAKHLNLPQDGAVDSTVRSLRLASIVIGIIAGQGVPIAALLDLICDALKEQFTDKLQEAFAPAHEALARADPRLVEQRSDSGQPDRDRSHTLDAAGSAPADHRLDPAEQSDVEVVDPDEPPSIIVGRAPPTSSHLTDEPPSIVAGRQERAGYETDDRRPTIIVAENAPRHVRDVEEQIVCRLYKRTLPWTLPS